MERTRRGKEEGGAALEQPQHSHFEECEEREKELAKLASCSGEAAPAVVVLPQLGEAVKEEAGEEEEVVEEEKSRTDIASFFVVAGCSRNAVEARTNAV